jgi:hypothetical protein
MIPWATGLGFRGGLLYGLRIDNVVSLNTSVDYYRASYQSTASNISANISSTQLSSETLANLFVGMVNLRIDIPFAIADVVEPYVQLGTGYEIMVNTYKQTTGDQNYVFIGDFLAFQLEAGARYKLGDKSYLFGSLGYNFATVVKSRNPNDTLIVGEKIDVGGLSFLLGIGFKL